MNLSDKLIELRKEKGWSQEDFAERLDVSRQAISRWENGTAFPDAQNLLRISKLFNVTSDYLLNDDYERDTYISAVEETTKEETIEEKEAPIQKKKYPYLIFAICFIILAVCTVVAVYSKKGPTDKEEHTHILSSSVRANEVAPTCTSEGSYDEVVYCAECNEELLRTTKRIEKLAHTPTSSVKENEIKSTCTVNGLYDEVIYCAVCNGEVLRTTKTVEKCAHTPSSSVKENVVAANCTQEGSYDEVIRCSVCTKEILRTKKSSERAAHWFENKKCIVCGEAQPSEGLIYMSNGDGTCTVDVGTCKDEDVVIPAYAPSGEKVIYIKPYAFAGCQWLKSVLIPETVTVVGEGAFRHCANLERASLPKGLTVIQAYTFQGCESLKEITIPANVATIAPEAFAECYACESIVIPANVSNIGMFAFRNFSHCNGTVIFENYTGWRLYDSSDSFVKSMDFSSGTFKPVFYLTFMYSDHTWKRN